MTKAEILEAIKGLSVLDLSDLVKDLEEAFGVSAAPVAVAAAASPAAAVAVAEEEEQSEFRVVLQDFGENKINVIKAVREVTSLGLKEAKELVESAPAPVMDGIPKDEAESIRVKLSEAGAAVAVE